jgi:effector-binding domain-containing protein
MVEIERVTTLARPTAVVRGETTQPEIPKKLIEFLDEVYAAAKSGAFTQDGQNIAVYGVNANPFPMEAGIEVAPGFTEPAGRVVPSTLPAGEAVRAVHVGPYQELRRTYEAVQAWARNEGVALGVCWEVYGDWEEDESKLTTEVFHLIV